MQHYLAQEVFANQHLLKTLAWVFTMISGVASITLTIHKFGLPKWKQITLICGVLAFGLAVVFFVIPRMTTFNGPAMLSVEDTQHLQALASELGDYSGGYEKTEAGFVSKPMRGEVNRVSEHLFAVMHPDGHFDAIYSGDFFTAQIDGSEVSCELIDMGDDRVLIVRGDDTEIVKLGADQSKNTFKIKKVSVQQPRQA